jgi:hypothetical protein
MTVYSCKCCRKVASVQTQPSLNGRASTLQIECRTPSCENRMMTVFTSSTPDPENDAYIARYYVVHEDVPPERRIVGKLANMERVAGELSFYAAQVGDARLAIEVGNLEEQIGKTLSEARRTANNAENGAQSR